MNKMNNISWRRETYFLVYCGERVVLKRSLSIHSGLGIKSPVQTHILMPFHKHMNWRKLKGKLNIMIGHRFSVKSAQTQYTKSSKVVVVVVVQTAL